MTKTVAQTRPEIRPPTKVQTNGHKPAETVRIEEVTPKKAATWLEGNQYNRELRENRVYQLAGALERDEWKLTGDAIVFDDEGRLINGQHRLSSIVRANRPARLIVLRNVPAETQDVMDNGLRRTLADTLKLRGHSNYFALAAGLNWFYRLEYIEETGNVHFANPGERPTTPQGLKILDEHPDFPDYLRRALSVTRAVRVRVSVASAVWYRLSLLHNGEEDAEAFFDKLTTGIELKKDDPIYHLRRGLLADASSLRKMPDYRQAAVMCKAWNLWREGKPVHQLAWKYGATSREAFPIPQ